MSIEVAPLVGGIIGFGLLVGLAQMALRAWADCEERRGTLFLCVVYRICAGAIVSSWAVLSIVVTLIWLKGVLE